MKLVTFEVPTPLGPVERLGALRDGRIVDLNLATALLYLKERRPRAVERAGFFVPPDMLGLLDAGEEGLSGARRALESVKGEPAGPRGERVVWKEGEVKLKAPLPRPRFLRDFSAFEEHVKAGAKRRNEELAPAWYDQPIYHKQNPRQITGPGEVLPWPSYTRKFDFEFEFCAITGKPGRDIPVAEAARHIAGYCVMNDCSARDIQKYEMLCRMGPAKAKDFGTSLGPWLVTADEWDGRAPEMIVRVNGEEWSRSKGSQPYWSFAVMLSHVSQGENVLPGEILGSGSFYTGCGLDLDRWLKPGDVLELDAGPLGVLKNVVGTPRGQVRLKYNRDGSLAS